MALTCPKCGWKDKPSHKKYYKSRHLVRPTCSKCNPALKQKIKKASKKFLILTFSNNYYLPLACIPYMPVLMLLIAKFNGLLQMLTIGVPYLSNESFHVAINFILWMSGVMINASISVKVCDKLEKKIL